MELVSCDSFVYPIHAEVLYDICLCTSGVFLLIDFDVTPGTTFGSAVLIVQWVFGHRNL